MMKIYKCNWLLYDNAVRVEMYNKGTEASRNILRSINLKNINVKWRGNKLIVIDRNENIEFRSVICICL